MSGGAALTLGDADATSRSQLGQPGNDRFRTRVKTELSNKCRTREAHRSN